MKQSILIALGILLAVGSVFTIRRSEQLRMEDKIRSLTVQIDSAQDPEAPSARLSGTSSGPLFSSASSLLATLHAPFDAEDTLAELRHIDDTETPMDSFVVREALLSLLSQKELLELQVALETAPEHPSNEWIKVAMDRLLGVPQPDVREVLNQTLADGGPIKNLFWRFEGWAESEPEAARKWLDEAIAAGHLEREGTESHPMANFTHSYTMALVQTDVPGALNYYKDLNPEMQRNVGRDLFAKLAWQGEVGAARTFFAELPDRDAQIRSLRRLHRDVERKGDEYPDLRTIFDEAMEVSGLTQDEIEKNE